VGMRHERDRTDVIDVISWWREVKYECCMVRRTTQRAPAPSVSAASIFRILAISVV
jgi:hypothetical protein